MSRSLAAGLAGFVATAAIAIALPNFAPLDRFVHGWLQNARDCGTERLGWNLGLGVGFLLFAAVGLVLLARPRLTAIGTAVAAIASGAVLVEAAKTVFERLRPDQMPHETLGNAFPSGHVCNTTVMAIALWWLARRSGSRGTVCAVAVLVSLAIAAQGVSRLLVGSHWASDVLASIALGAAWLGLVAGVSARPNGLVRAALAAALIAAVLATVARVPLPSPHRSPEPIAVVDFDGARAGAATRGRWIHGHREPIGGVAWLAEREGAIELPDLPAPPYEIRLAVRPTVRGRERVRGCVHLELSLGDWSSGPISLLRGWRVLRFSPPASAWGPEPPVLRLRVAPDADTAAHRGDFGWIALRWIRLYDGARGDRPRFSSRKKTPAAPPRSNRTTCSVAAPYAIAIGTKKA